MFSIWRTLRFGARLSCAQYSAHRSIMCKSNGAGVFHHNRFIHECSNERKELGKLEGKMKLMFTCKKCQTRNSKLISKLAYNKGVIIVTCTGCKNNHLIADNLGWFSEINQKINIEKLMALKGETVRKILNDREGYFEAVLNEEFKLHQKNASETINSNNMEEDSDKIKQVEMLKES
nr:PREDICTED: DNL-type zinc finger protein-like [Linepithema humile]